MLQREQASRLAEIALGHVTREYPHKLDQVLTGPGDLAEPHVLHPMFHGSFDWHSCVHGFWMLARVLRRFPDLPQAGRIRSQFAATFAAEPVAAEVAYLARPMTRTFERPYGWGWLLMLAAELAQSSDADARRWSVALEPLTEAFTQRFLQHLPKATYPVRSGVHSSTAFGLTLALEFAAICNHAGLRDAAQEAARRWFGADVDCQAWEPSGEDFLSPSLMESVCMQRVLPGDEFAGWFARFLPRVAQQEPGNLFQPVTVSDRSDGRIAHLDGLNLSRAWCWSLLSASVPASDPRSPVMRDAAMRHLQASLPNVAGDYMGEHWLASFALLAIEGQASLTARLPLTSEAAPRTCGRGGRPAPA